jgi:hypothetical protein
MAQRSLIGFELLTGFRPSADRLNLTRAPAFPDQPSRLAARQPSVAGLALLGQDDAHNASVQTFCGVVIDGSSQIFQIAACAALVSAIFLIGTAGLASNF